MLKKVFTTKILVIVFLVIVVLVGYGLITRCDHVAIYKYCPAEKPQSGR